jgi:hypothetical protein
LQDAANAQYFEHYLKNLASWYDLNDLNATFAGRIGQRASQDSQLLLSAIVAFAAMHQSRTGNSAAKPCAEAHHAHCLRLLVRLKPQHPAVKDGTALAATCLLRSYEILAGKAQEQESE